MKQIKRIFTVTGYSNSGKSELVAQLVPELKKRGHSVGVIKSMQSHHPDHSFSLHSPTSDTGRHLQAGASLVATYTPNETSLTYPRSIDLDFLLDQFDTDWVIIEGGKSLTLPRIITLKEASDLEALRTPASLAVSGRAVQEFGEIAGLPSFHTYNDLSDLVDLLEEKLTTKKD
ncbi:molybdopterin-guanine dinucleotide biosynthesis protein B [Hutsoniella sourekii]|uniref:molybdopterin-guanine dinucleotide biosynthesis protein B n=1 Tax=Hutsoniella sourekii TaxID=87650 RepID=UPI0004841D2C|nr:molybdopterin-guanine dinucleotide biosynthesis protein B [Hutsoniella sourekii]